MKKYYTYTCLSLFCVIGLFIIVGFCKATVKRATQGKPNILFILTDDQSYNTIHALGNNEVFTPNIDFLVNNGTSFSHAYNMGGWNGAICVASRTMLLTGMAIWQAKNNATMLDSLAEKGELWSQKLQQAGYETYMTGKWHIKANAKNIFDHTIHIRPGMPNQTPKGYNRPLSVNDLIWQPWDTTFEGYWKGGKHWSEVLAEDATDYIKQAAKQDKPFLCT